MPVTRLFPANTDASGSDLFVTGAGTHHAALSDASDASHVNRQLGQFDTARQCHGFTVTQLPYRSVRIGGVVMNVRSWCSVNAAQRVRAGNDGSGAGFLMDQVMSDVITTYSTGSLDLGGVDTINAMGWYVRHDWRVGFPDGSIGRTYELNFDVTWFPTSGLRVMLLGLLGPVVALGLHEMPRLNGYLWRRYRTRLLPDELRQAWLEVRAYRHPRSVLVGARFARNSPENRRISF